MMNPERLDPPNDSLRLRVQLAHVALMSTPIEEMLFPAEDDVRYMDILDKSHRKYLEPESPEGPIIGKLNIKYYPRGGIVSIHNVALDEEYRGRRWGLEIYRSIPHMPLPDGEDFHDSGYRFLSDTNDSVAGKRVWRSLAQKGLAARIARGKYEMNHDAPRPDIMAVDELLF